jgi:hypothetical protein
MKIGDTIECDGVVYEATGGACYECDLSVNSCKTPCGGMPGGPILKKKEIKMEKYTEIKSAGELAQAIIDGKKVEYYEEGYAAPTLIDASYSLEDLEREWGCSRKNDSSYRIVNTPTEPTPTIAELWDKVFVHKISLLISRLMAINLNVAPEEYLFFSWENDLSSYKIFDTIQEAQKYVEEKLKDK